MKTQMRFQKYLCLAMLLVGVLALIYAFCYSTGALSELGYGLKSNFTVDGAAEVDIFIAEGKYDATLYNDIQDFNNALLYCGIIILLLAVLLYVTACNRRRNYYITNYVATGLCAGGNIIISVILMAMNAYWLDKFNNIDFEAWKAFNDNPENIGSAFSHYSESTLWFNIGFVVYAIVIVASIVLILNLVWKILLMKGEKKLLNSSATVEEGVAV